MNLAALEVFALITFLLTMYSSWIGDDDVVYACMHRKPTNHEGLRRMRYVLVKGFASMSCGGYFASVFGEYILKPTVMPQISHDQAVLIILIFMGITGLLIGVIQNVIRQYQGRQLRPPFDKELFVYNLNRRRKFDRNGREIR